MNEQKARLVREGFFAGIVGYGAVVALFAIANVMSGDRERCLDAGMNDYIGKPVQLDVLKQVLARWLAKDYSV